jgi:hypothetical protein
MRVIIMKGERVDRITIHRTNGTQTQTCFSKKGPLPHDAIHYVVEDVIGLTRGFWGMIASGLDPQAVQDIAKAGGHASASRAHAPDPDIVQLIQAERLVECFEANIWGAPADPDTLRAVAQVACEASHVPSPDLPDAAILHITDRVAALHRDWVPATMGHVFSFVWPDT